MPELRRDPTSGRWIAIATERADRPSSFSDSHSLPGNDPATLPDDPAHCPFCEGHEDQTPPEVLAYRGPGAAPNTPGWTVRVVPNKYPAFSTVDGLPNLRRRGLYESSNGLGAHEVIINSPGHSVPIALMSAEGASDLVRAWRDRMRHWQRHERIQYVALICNHGRDAGASLAHPHCQLLAVSVLPSTLVTELREAGYYMDTRAQCLYCGLLAQEQSELTRIVWQNADFVAFCPWAASVPFETWIMPRRHSADFTAILRDEIPQLADMLRQVLAKLYFGLNDPPLNFFMRTAPAHRNVDRIYHWHLIIRPCLSQEAGFEFSTGILINTVAPGAAAEFLRSVHPAIPERPSGPA